ncbi:MAG: hypothetical protein KKC76_21390 [Proteobacteria bacterium]|nr:hypothetical protein [Pseudomonadota bacterium]MBU4296507.1 hypothetical protein [Pseudomonadota bacterium]MCG2745984.1 hypothetical protein [Desulfobulbaceae bacterium]
MKKWIKREDLMLQEQLIAGLFAMRDHVATHVLTRLVPAFFPSGARDACTDHNPVIARINR